MAREMVGRKYVLMIKDNFEGERENDEETNRQRNRSIIKMKSY
jgi:hypothetical protein